jgi:hypothetical protein
MGRLGTLGCAGQGRAGQGRNARRSLADCVQQQSAEWRPNGGAPPPPPPQQRCARRPRLLPRRRSWPTCGPSRRSWTSRLLTTRCGSSGCLCVPDVAWERHSAAVYLRLPGGRPLPCPTTAHACAGGPLGCPKARALLTLRAAPRTAAGPPRCGLHDRDGAQAQRQAAAGGAGGHGCNTGDHPRSAIAINTRIPLLSCL